MRACVGSLGNMATERYERSEPNSLFNWEQNQTNLRALTCLPFIHCSVAFVLLVFFQFL